MATRLEKRERRLQALLERWNGRLRKHQSARLLAGLLIFVSLVPLSMQPAARVGFSVPGILLILFAYLVVRTGRIKRHVLQLEQLQKFVSRQKNRCLGRPSGSPWESAQKIASEFPLVRDLGLVGPHSLWTVLNETFSEGGQRRLLQWLSEAPLDKLILKQRQERIQQLRPLSWFYTRLGLGAKSSELNMSTLQIVDFLKHSFVGGSFQKLFWFHWAVWILMVGAGLARIFFQLPLPSIVFLIFPMVSLSSLGSLGAAFLQGTGLAHHLEALEPVFSEIEKRTRSNQTLRELCPEIHRSQPSLAARKLDFILGFVGTQTNPLLHFLLNAFMPWTITSVFFLERLRLRMAHDFPHCVAELSEFEVYGSLLIFDKYQSQTYPNYADTMALSFTEVFHPLLERGKVVPNSFHFSDGKSLGLLTGSNMSGKSTFLRTLGVNQILANMGAPVLADSFVTHSVRVETCIEVSDSLRDGYSYFYAEVRRLKDILQTAERKEPVLFLIDEIFRGTNNRERQLGSRAVIQTLAQEKTSLGFISTHDLELTVLEESIPSVMNLHFREDIDENGKMVFHYHLKQGSCPTTNALRIMAAEGIKVEV